MLYRSSLVVVRRETGDPAKRFQSAAELTAVLEALSGGAKPLPRIRHRWRSWAAAVAIVVVAAGVYWQAGRHDRLDNDVGEIADLSVDLGGSGGAGFPAGHGHAAEGV